MARIDNDNLDDVNRQIRINELKTHCRKADFLQQLLKAGVRESSNSRICSVELSDMMTNLVDLQTSNQFGNRDVLTTHSFSCRLIEMNYRAATKCFRV
jgi:hypothetical protein